MYQVNAEGTRMGNEDWYRGPDWDAQTQADFGSRLARARSQKAQYMLIKGMGLADAERADVREFGRDLLRRMLAEESATAVDIIRAHQALGAAYSRDGFFVQAAEHLLEALKMQDDCLTVDTGADLELAELIVTAGWSDRYVEALDWLDHFWAAESPFPSTNFRALLADARIADHMGQRDRARERAKQALDLLNENKAPFSRHPGIGLIKTDRKTVRELERLAR